MCVLERDRPIASVDGMVRWRDWAYPMLAFMLSFVEGLEDPDVVKGSKVG